MMRNLRLVARAATRNLLNGRDSLFLLYEPFGFSHLFRLEAWKHMKSCIVIILCNAARWVRQNVLISTWQRAKIRKRKNFSLLLLPHAFAFCILNIKKQQQLHQDDTRAFSSFSELFSKIFSRQCSPAHEKSCRRRNRISFKILL